MKNGIDSLFPYVVAELVKENNLYIRNHIIWYNPKKQQRNDNLDYAYNTIIMIAKDSKDYTFNLDDIREKHIWRDHEWGKGRRSRYNPLGKNPSNFWLPTESEKGKVTKHLVMNTNDILERIIKVATNESDEIINYSLELKESLEQISSILKRKICFYQLDLSEILETEKKNKILKSIEEISKIKDKNDWTNNVFYKTCENMSEIPNNSISVIITSPPYWGMRDYGVDNQIGFDESYLNYMNRLKIVFSECFRVLKNNGSFWLNINKRVIEGNVLFMNYDLTKIAMSVGFTVRNTIIWHRALSIPGTGVNNFTDRFEYVMLFGKQSYNIKLIKENCDFNDYIHTNYNNQINSWYIWRNVGNLGEKIETEHNKKLIKHTAVFPKELVRRIILITTEKGDVVLDPFLGSGTTIVVAEKHHRKWAGYELNEKFKHLIESRLKKETYTLDHFLKNKEK